MKGRRGRTRKQQLDDLKETTRGELVSEGARDTLCGPGSVVGIATGYGLDVAGIESRGGEIFRTCADRA